MDEKLLDEILNFVDMQFADETTKKKIERIVEDGIADIDEMSGFENDYMQAGRARSLLFNRTQYELNNALDDFYINYRKEIVTFINISRVKNAQSKDGQTV